MWRLGDIRGTDGKRRGDYGGHAPEAVGRHGAVGRCAALTSAAAAETIPLPDAGASAQGRGRLRQPSRPAKRPVRQNPAGLAAGLRSLFHLDKQPEAPAAPAATTTVAFTPTQRTQIDKVSAYLSSVQQMVGQFRPGRARRQPRQGRILYPEARQDPLRVRPAEPGRDHRRRPIGGGARPQARNAGSLSALADTRCGFCFPTGSTSCERHQCRGGARR